MASTGAEARKRSHSMRDPFVGPTAAARSHKFKTKDQFHYLITGATFAAAPVADGAAANDAPRVADGDGAGVDGDGAGATDGDTGAARGDGGAARGGVAAAAAAAAEAAAALDVAPDTGPATPSDALSLFCYLCFRLCSPASVPPPFPALPPFGPSHALRPLPGLHISIPKRAQA